ncbi:exodeoxyribonuclease VII large subunit [Rariglobus hedericola]|uniref:exodeoxyribonuclease VII large subunit n=1 Tax=Rariglobus hedericola TaxID=2597822 RepID=UPI001EF160D0|nr:exodeoxyribonuclease VII large subunit [Rariglobus hedericola]
MSEFTRRVKTVLESQVRPGWVRGEVSNLRAQASGHVYFSLKDAGAQLSSVMFRGDAARQDVKLRDGLQVVVYGEISVYEARGNYQLIVRAVIEDGVGRLQKEFEALKRRLADEGLFAAENKVAIPAMPQTVGFITSPTGAAVQDFLRILIRRGWRGRVVVLPAKVQGDGAAAEIIEMLQLAQDEAACGVRFDLLVIGRGGGSLEDLWAFNEEPLVRAVAACRLPIISAVGHEIDFTLGDFAADVRAETPSAAAELISSGFVAATERAARLDEDLNHHVDAALESAADRLDHARSRLRLLAPSAQVERGFLRLDDLANRLSGALSATVQTRRQRLSEVRSLLRERSPQRRVESESQRLLALWKRLQAASPASVLNRGFVIMRDADGKPVQKKAAVQKGQRLAAEFADGTVAVKAEG